MTPITKFWLFHLPPPITPDTSSFQQLFNEILDLTTSYTNSDKLAGVPPMHFLYHVLNSPSISGDEVDNACMMITGYPSLEMNLECDKVYAQMFMSRMTEIGVKHDWLRMIEKDIRDINLGENIVITCEKEESAITGVEGSGGWDIQDKQAKEGQRIWIRVSQAHEAEEVDSVGQEEMNGLARYDLKQIMAR